MGSRRSVCAGDSCGFPEMAAYVGAHFDGRLVTAAATCTSRCVPTCCLHNDYEPLTARRGRRQIWQQSDNRSSVAPGMDVCRRLTRSVGG